MQLHRPPHVREAGDGHCESRPGSQCYASTPNADERASPRSGRSVDTSPHRHPRRRRFRGGAAAATFHRRRRLP
eukprot:9475070-Pyramimonas_sp.AAC.1